jgi:lactose/L-arabinose transport system substrate-binding protein
MKKILAVLLAVVILAGMLTACSAGSENTAASTAPAASASAAASAAASKSAASSAASSGKKTITVWAWDAKFNVAIMNDAAKRYEANHPDVTVNVVEMAKADVEQKLNTALASKTTEGLPDITLIEDYNAQKYIKSYPGAFSDLTSAIKSDDFAPYKTQIMTIDGKLYGVPFDSGVAGMFYRTDLLEQAGFKAEDLNNITWDRFIEIGKTVKEKTGKYMLGFQLSDGGLMRIMLQSAGSWYFNADGTVNIAKNDVLKEAMETYKKINDSGIFKPTTSWDEWVGAINSGDAATITTGVWIVGSIKAAADQSGKWAVAPVPRLNNANSKNASNLGGSSWYVLDQSANRDAAIDFLKTMYDGDMDFYQNILINQGAMGTYLPAASGEAYAKADDFFGGTAIYKDLSAWVKDIPAVSYGAYTYEADAAVMAQIDAFCKGSVTVDKALSDAQAQVEVQIG